MLKHELSRRKCLKSKSDVHISELLFYSEMKELSLDPHCAGDKDVILVVFQHRKSK